MGTMEVEVEAFKNARPINWLPCYPMKYHKDPEALRRTLVERGRKFVGLKGMQYKFHKGLLSYPYLQPLAELIVIQVSHFTRSAVRSSKSTSMAV